MSKASIRIEGVIGEHVPVSHKEMAHFTYSDLLAFLQEPDTQSAQEIEIDLGTIGGDVKHGLKMYDALVAQKKLGKKIITRGETYDSIGTVLLAAGDVRLSVRGAEPLFHAAWLSPEDLDKSLQLNKSTLQAIAVENEFADSQIMGVYANVVPRDKLSEFKKLVDVEGGTKLTDQQLLDFGFATKIIDGQPKKNFRALAYNSETSKLLNQNQMESKEVLDKITAMETKTESLFAKVLKALNLSPKNMDMPLQSGGSISVEMADGEDPVGKPAFVTSETGEKTPAPAGSHTLSDGSTLVIAEGGLVESVAAQMAAEEKEQEELEAAVSQAVAAKEEEMKAAFEEEKKENLALVAEMQNSLKAFAKELKELKETVPGDETKEFKPRALNLPEGKEWKDMNQAEKLQFRALQNLRKEKV